MMKPVVDFSHIDTEAKAKAAVNAGILERMLLLPIEFGGTDHADNIIFVPCGTSTIKQGIDVNVITHMIEDGLASEYTVAPEYLGESIVPSALVITASNPGEFSTRIEIWGGRPVPKV